MCHARRGKECTWAITVMPGMFLFVFTDLVSFLARSCTASWGKQPPTYHHTCNAPHHKDHNLPSACSADKSPCLLTEAMTINDTWHSPFERAVSASDLWNGSSCRPGPGQLWRLRSALEECTAGSTRSCAARPSSAACETAAPTQHVKSPFYDTGCMNWQGDINAFPGSFRQPISFCPVNSETHTAAERSKGL